MAIYLSSKTVRRRVIVGTVILAVIGVSGCGVQKDTISIGKTHEAVLPLTAGTASNVSPTTTASVGSSLPSMYVNPLNVFANGNGFTSSDLTAFNDSIISCMAMEGWQYYADPTALQISTPDRVSDLISYRASYGLGGPNQVPLSSDPNLSYVNTLSSSSQVQYYADLNGSDGEGASQVGAPYGCEPLALQAIRKGLPIKNAAFQVAWGNDVKALEASAGFLSAQNGFQQCATSAGYPDLSVSDLIDGSSASQPSSSSSGSTPTTTIPTSQEQNSVSIAEANAGMSCLVNSYLPLTQPAEIADVQELASEFPQYLTRAQAISAGDSVNP